MIKQSNDKTKGLWQIYTDAQEQILRANAVPISIVAESVKPTNGRVILKAEETNNVDALLERMSSLFDIQKEELLNPNQCIFVDKQKVPSLEIRQSLSSQAERYHIKYSPSPIIDGVIRSNDEILRSFTSILLDSDYDYSYDKDGRLQIALSNIDSLKSRILQNDKIKDNISGIATVVFHLQPSPTYFLKREYPNIPWQHSTKIFNNERVSDLIVVNQIELIDGYLNDSILNTLQSSLGLYLNEFSFAFEVNENLVKTVRTSKIEMPTYNKEEGAFIIRFKRNHSANEDEFFENTSGITYAYTFYKRIFDRYYGNENVKLKFSKFCYRYNAEDFIENYVTNNDDWKEDFWDTLQKQYDKTKISVSQSTDSINIGFDWKEESIKNILMEICNSTPSILLTYDACHKCSIDIMVLDSTLEKAEATLREQFPSIQISRNIWTGDLVFWQEYKNSHQHDRIYQNLERQISELDLNGYTIAINSIPLGKEKFILKIDHDSLHDSLEESLKSMRGKEFNISGNIKFGKLTRINFPLLTFTLENPDDETILQLLEGGLVNRLYPDITGDLEKISRLKNAFNSIVNGIGLKNDNLSQFIFDASKAKPIENIDFYTNERSEFYQDFVLHRLNKRITDSQLKAIIKAVKAEDLAVIQGPPGTGKSTAIAEIIWQHVRMNPKERILLTSETNLAVDNAIDRVVNKSHNLVKPIRIGEDSRLISEGRQFSIEAMLEWVENGLVLSKRKKMMEDENDDIDSCNCTQKIILENWIENILRRVDTTKISTEAYENWKEYLSNPNKSVRQLLYNEYIKHCNVIGATCSSIGEKSTKGAPTSFYKQYCQVFGKVEEKLNRDGNPYNTYSGEVSFDTVIQDESSKATPAELSLPLIYGKKNIVIGDQRQLPPLLDREQFNSSFDFLLKDIEDISEKRKLGRLQKYVEDHFDEMEISHFQRLIESINPSLKGVFNTQYRMHWAINEAIAQFYEEDGGLECGLDKQFAEDPDISNPHSRFHGIEIEGLIRPTDHIIWIDTDSPEIQEGTSRVNYGEIDIIRKVLEKFSHSESFQKYQDLWETDIDKQIGLISFYGKQIKYLYQLSREFPDLKLKIDTVDRFQGMERNIIIVSMVRSACIAVDKEQRPDYELYGSLGYAPQNELGFAQSPNRLNVALSRAKRLLIIVGNSQLFRRKEIYDNVFNIIDKSICGNIIPGKEWIGKI